MVQDEGDDEGRAAPTRRRRLVAALAAPALLLAIAVLAALLVDASEDGGTAVGASASSSTSVGVTTTQQPVSSTTSAPGPPTTTAPATTSPPPAPDPDEPPTPTTEPSEPRCEPAHFTATATPDKPTYRRGERVRITATFTNTSGKTCYWASTQGILEARDAAGRLVGPLGAVIGDGFRWIPFAAGETMTDSIDWDQRICGSPPCVPAPPGPYTATLILDPFGSPSTSFTLVAG